MIADRLDGCKGAKEHALARRKPSNLARQHEADYIQEQGFEPVSVYRAVCVRYIESMMLCVDNPYRGKEKTISITVWVPARALAL